MSWKTNCPEIFNLYTKGKSRITILFLYKKCTYLVASVPNASCPKGKLVLGSLISFSETIVESLICWDLADCWWDLAESWMRYSWVADAVYPDKGYPGWNLAESWMRSKRVWMRFSKEWMRFSRVVDDIYLRHGLNLYETRMRSSRLCMRSSWVVDDFSRVRYIPDEI
jgi:hypothetical protein